MSPEGIWRKIDEVERAVAIRVASAIAIRNVDNYVDLKVIVMRLSEATWDKECRKHIVKCVRGNHDDKSRFCCILAILGLAKLRKRYCK